jgi:hypothetical protein
MSEFTEDGYTNLGKLVMALAERGLLVRVGQQQSVLTGATVTLKVTQMVKGRSVDLTEALSPLALSEIRDAQVIASAIQEKLRKGP